jgi:hypothetical protein
MGESPMGAGREHGRQILGGLRIQGLGEHMAYTCPLHHDTLLACSTCYVLSLPAARVERAVEQGARYIGVRLDYPQFEIPCQTCGRELVCFRCNMEVLAEAGHDQED